MGAILSRKVVTTYAGLTGLGGYKGQSVRGGWGVSLQARHTNFLELSAMFLPLKRFIPFLRDHYVLI